jgi:hypothetical protein
VRPCISSSGYRDAGLYLLLRVQECRFITLSQGAGLMVLSMGDGLLTHLPWVSRPNRNKVCYMMSNYMSFFPLLHTHHHPNSLAHTHTHTHTHILNCRKRGQDSCFPGNQSNTHIPTHKNTRKEAAFIFPVRVKAFAYQTSIFFVPG